MHVSEVEGSGSAAHGQAGTIGLTWSQVHARDVMRMDGDGRRLDGPWAISPAVQLHVELHRARDVVVAVHNQPE